MSRFSFLCSGIISAIAFSPSHNGMLATGSYSQSTAIYREDKMELLYVLHGQEGGVTHVSEYCHSLPILIVIYNNNLSTCSFSFYRSNSLKTVTIFIPGAER